MLSIEIFSWDRKLHLHLLLMALMLRSGGAADCGLQSRNISCTSGFCCSSSGSCGGTLSYCGPGCQTQFGSCWPEAPTPHSRPIGCSPEKPCPNIHQCCSKSSFCGSTADFCGDGCVHGPCWSRGKVSRGLTTGQTIVIIFGSAFVLFLGMLATVLAVRRAIEGPNLAPQQIATAPQAGGDYGHGVASEAVPMATKTSSEADVVGMRYSYEALRDATNGFAKELGRGSFGIVYKGTLPDGQDVAVKKLLDNQHGVKELEAEMRTLGSIKHSNLVNLQGFCIETGQPPFVIYEYMLNGSLDKWIFDQERWLPWETRVNIARGTAKGLSFLHKELQIGQAIVHLDIKPENILLNESFSPKVADFGMAKLIFQTRSRTIAAGGTFGYMAPEVQNQSASTKMDVYSFGMVLLELVAGRRHLDHSLPDDKFFLPAWTLRRLIPHHESEVVDPRLNGKYDISQAREILMIALSCLQQDPELRPDMSEVVRMLESLKFPSELPVGLIVEIERTERLVRRPVLALGWKADADSFFIDFGSDRSYLNEDRSSNVTVDSIPTAIPNAPPASVVA